MNPRFLAFIATLAAALTAICGADLSGVISLLPDKWAGIIAVSLPGIAAFVHFLDIFGDVADDGKRNGSFRGGGSLKLLPLLLALALCLASGVLTSCNALGSAVTGVPIDTTAVRREGGDPVNVATLDLLQAEASPPDSVWGLYNAGRLAARASEVIRSIK